eukprot:5203437-Pleurochrysis_carterae.AAC.1
MMRARISSGGREGSARACGRRRLSLRWLRLGCRRLALLCKVACGTRNAPRLAFRQRCIQILCRSHELGAPRRILAQRACPFAQGMLRLGETSFCDGREHSVVEGKISL